MTTLLMVRTGTKYGPEYVERLVAGVRRHLKIGRAILLTDQPERFAGVDVVDVNGLNLPGWWAKMALLNPDIRGEGTGLYLDLDTVVIGKLQPLLTFTPKVFCVAGSFARQFGSLTWPCRYGSCVMLLPEGWGMTLWMKFLSLRDRLMALPRGDQQALEQLYPEAPLIQDYLNPRFFLNYRELAKYPDGPPLLSALVIFGGSRKPHNCDVPWVKGAWECSPTTRIA